MPDTTNPATAAPPPPAPPPPTGADGKDYWEARKFEAEVEELRRPYYHKPGFWLSAGTGLVTVAAAATAVVGVVIQSANSTLEYKRADVLREQAEFKVARAAFEVEKTEHQLKQSRDQLDALHRDVKSQQDRLKELSRLAGEIQQRERLNEDKRAVQFNNLFKGKASPFLGPKIDDGFPSLFPVAPDEELATLRRRQTELLESSLRHAELIRRGAPASANP